MDEVDFRPTSALLVGGQGRMGRWLLPHLTAAGLKVQVADNVGGPWDPALAASRDLVILAVPVPQVAQVASQVGPHTTQGSLVMDLASVKQEPLAAMLQHCQGQVVGCHPLFGPARRDARGQVVFLCQGRGQAGMDWAISFWRGLGARVEIMEPSRHDKLMAQVQSLRHLTLAAMGLALSRAGFDIQNDLDLAGPWTQELLGLLARQGNQPARLYADLAAGNPHAAGMLVNLSEALQDMQACLERGSIDELERLFHDGAAITKDTDSFSLTQPGAWGKKVSWQL